MAELGHENVIAQLVSEHFRTLRATAAVEREWFSFGLSVKRARPGAALDLR
jgi:hypothetical protein